MTKDFQGSPQAWQRITEPLERIDAKLEKFANEKDLPLGKITKNWPNREFRWTYQIERLIEIYLEDEKELTWSLWICAYQYANSLQLTKKKIILKGISIEELNMQLENALEDAYKKVMSWSKGSLSEVAM